jgi:carbamoyltransferase
MKVLSIFSGHDASACLIINGKIERYFKEERYSKIKRDKGLDNIFNLCLDHCVIKSDVFNLSTNFSYAIQNQKYKEVTKKNSNIKILKCKSNHHLYHASLSFYNSGFDRALLIVIDSVGNVINNNVFECESIYVGEYPDKIVPIYKNYFSRDYLNKKFHKYINGCEYVCNTSFGIGALYASAAIFMGQTEDDCGKAMGLSSYGSPIIGSPEFFSDILVNPNSIDWILNYMEKNYDVLNKENYKFYADYCYEIQKQTQEVFCRLIQKGIEKTGIKKVCISGGYGMNIIANNLVLERFPDVDFFFEPLCDDGGISIGSAMYFYRNLTKDEKIYPLETTSTHGFLYDVNKYKNKFAEICDIAKILYQNKSIAIYTGYAESGQRALGNRSILFNALNPNAKNIVNNIKKREWYRPFAAIVLEEDASLYFDMGRIKSNEYMTVCFPVKTDLIPGVTHVDKTCRVQTVSSGHLYDILLEFKKLSGHGILLNTSFNLAGEPLVETPEDAFNTLNNSLLDYLWFEETKQLFN